MRTNGRLRAAVALGNNPQTGLLELAVFEYDGGPFELQPRISEDSIYLVDATRPHAYGLRITGDLDALERLSNALSTMVRNARKNPNADDSES